MTDSGPGSPEDAAAGRDDPRWSSSLSNSSLGPLDGAGEEPPNPFSREGAQASEATGVDASIGSATAPTSPPSVEPTHLPSANETWPGYPPASDPYVASKLEKLATKRPNGAEAASHTTVASTAPGLSQRNRGCWTFGVT